MRRSTQGYRWDAPGHLGWRGNENAEPAQELGPSGGIYASTRVLIRHHRNLAYPADWLFDHIARHPPFMDDWLIQANRIPGALQTL